MSPEDLLRGSVYKSLETDEELAARVTAVHPWFKNYHGGAYLDVVAWDLCRIQRRIIERSACASSHATR